MARENGMMDFAKFCCYATATVAVLAASGFLLSFTITDPTIHTDRVIVAIALVAIPYVFTRCVWMLTQIKGRDL
jgi:hypothetical protein